MALKSYMVLLVAMLLPLTVLPATTLAPDPAVDTFDVVLQAFPNNGGSVTVNGTTYSTYPSTLKVEDNTQLNVTANAAAGFIFGQWHAVYANVLPDDYTNPMQVTVNQGDTIYVFFTDIPDSFNLTVNIGTPGAGNVTVNGNALGAYPATFRIPAGQTINASVLANTGYSFTDWAIKNHTLTPSSTDANVSFTLNTDDTLTARFFTWPDSLQLVVDIRPNILAGTVSVAGFTPPTYPYTVEVQENTNVDFNAVGKAFNTAQKEYNYVFDRYEFAYHTPQPSANEPLIYARIERADTVIAWFVNRPEQDTSSKVLIPTAFSPDGDGNNDVFKIVGERLAESYMEIYDRWGQRVFLSNSQGYGWNGNYNDKPCPLGVYTYTMSGVRLNGEKVKLSGAVTLLR